MAVRIVDDSHGVRMAVKVVPGASRDRIVGKLGDALKVAVSKPPEAGAANKAVIALLARSLDVDRADSIPTESVALGSLRHDRRACVCRISRVRVSFPDLFPAKTVGND